jgi:hypothetical protein
VHDFEPIFCELSLSSLTKISRSGAQLFLWQAHPKVHLNGGLGKPRSANQPPLHSFWLSQTPCHHYQLYLDMDSRSASQLEHIWQCCIAGYSPIDVSFYIHPFKLFLSP